MPKIKFLTTASNVGKCAQLKRSLEYFEYDYKIALHAWEGFGSKLIATRTALNELRKQGYSHFVYGDSYDSFVLGPMSEISGKILDFETILHSAEKANYPHPDKVYPEVGCVKPWQYLNGGGFLAPVDLWIELFDKRPCPPQLNDQVYQVDGYLANQASGKETLEKDCSIFQTYSFINEANADGPGDFQYIPGKFNGRLYNTVTKTFPVVIHGNGHTDMSRIYSLIP